MTSTFSRRDWLKSGLLASAGTLVLPSLSQQAEAASVSGPYGAVYLERHRELAYQAYLSEAPQIKARLSSNENPWGPSPKAKEALVKSVDSSFMYAGPVVGELRKQLAAEAGVPEDHILLGAGSSELLMGSLMLYGPKGKILMADPCYISNRDDRGDNSGIAFDKVPLTTEYQYDLPAMASRVDSKTSMVYVCNPNNPTGVILPADQLRSFCETVSPKTTVLVDEAYIDYAKDPKTESMVDCVRKGQNVLILRTMSKLHAFAGLRVGYAVAKPEILKELRKYCSGGFSISTPSAAAAIASIKDTEFQQMTLKNTLESKKYLYDFLKQSDYTWLPSSANFVLFPLRMKGQTFTKGMMEQGVSVRQWEFDQQHWCRVSIGTMDQMKAFTGAFQKVVS
ncbi:pyridoxal phosphate-dependent aminotransferase [Tellurirhabdus bombi]|uniref:pyridoxal phosphate-dependent aminotransferase n=1 Tax=Tellurirhabdus bombi TaxID=2907205 RepID=UPI001F3614E6|nr:histidinol-phosphate transaminase [Tellurirhabdus bombi]